jgi:poly(3-hydroxybutyrate) depolymerase
MIPAHDSQGLRVPDIWLTEARSEREDGQTIYLNADDRPVVEHWVLPDFGHGWSGRTPVRVSGCRRTISSGFAR